MAIHIGGIAPDFTQESTEGTIRFHEWLGNHWGVLFSHPKDFTPVCTTELGVVAKLKREFDKRDCKVIGLSVDDVASHRRWIPDIEETQDVKMNFPILGDADRKVSRLYDMLHLELVDTLTARPFEWTDQLTVRSVFIIDPDKKVRAIITYPASTGRNFEEVLRVIDSLQLTDKYSVATPVDWRQGEDVIIVPSMTDSAELKRNFPKGWKELRPYLRMTPQPGK